MPLVRGLMCPVLDEPAIQGKGPGKYLVSAELHPSCLQTTGPLTQTLMPAKIQPVQLKTPARSPLLGPAGGEGEDPWPLSHVPMGFNSNRRTNNVLHQACAKSLNELLNTKH